MRKVLAFFLLSMPPQRTFNLVALDLALVILTWNRDHLFRNQIWSTVCLPSSRFLRRAGEAGKANDCYTGQWTVIYFHCSSPWWTDVERWWMLVVTGQFIFKIIGGILPADIWVSQNKDHQTSCGLHVKCNLTFLGNHPVLYRATLRPCSVWFVSDHHKHGHPSNDRNLPRGSWSSWAKGS